MAFTLASTTDTQEQIEHAASENWREPIPEPTPAPEPEPEPNLDGGAPETEENRTDAGPQDQAAAEHEEAPKKQGGFQKRITKLAAQLGERDAEIERLRRELAGHAPQAGEKSESRASGDPKEPNPDEFENANDYVKALARWEARQALHEVTRKSSEDSEAERQREVFRDYNSGVAAARAKYDDFDDVVGSDSVQIPQSAAVAIIEADNGPEIAYWLGKNPDAAAQLSEMSPAQAAVQIGRLSERLASPAAPEKTRRSVSAAPTPATPVRGSAPQITPNPQELSFRDYVKARRAGTIR